MSGLPQQHKALSALATRDELAPLIPRCSCGWTGRPVATAFDANRWVSTHQRSERRKRKAVQ